MEFTIVAGLSLKNLKPRVWDPQSSYYLEGLRAVMVSYAELNRMPALRQKAMELGLRNYLGVPKQVKIYLDNGAFYFISKGGQPAPRREYEEFVLNARPDWYAVPQDYIPTPRMSDAEQIACLRRTMRINRAYRHDGFVPIIHISRHLDEYLRQFRADERLQLKRMVALGGLVPNLLRAPKAMSYDKVLDDIHRARVELRDQKLHIFGIGGTATLHLAMLMEVNSADSAGWRNRAARGIVQLPGRGDRVVAELGSWSGRKPSKEEWRKLRNCCCPSCRRFGIEGLKAHRIEGFCNRAAHNLWVLLEEIAEIEARLADRTYSDWYESHLDNSTYLPLIRRTISHHGQSR